MKKTALTFLMLFFFCNSYCQNFTGCLEINFESIPGQTPAEGLAISNQYLASHGLSFVLDNGQPPILAEVGGAATAFGSVFGNDQPAPGFDIGSYFLTDDGSLSGLQMIPVIVNFQVPVDSFSACILDIDFGEYFIIQAIDEVGTIILSDTITAGDPSTGDGVPTCWGFNFEGCQGIVYSVRFEGYRELAGGFGLGMDNFSFCFAGVDIANQIQVETETATCTDNTGAISLINLSEEDYLYSLDGINFQSDPYFDDLPLGTYTVFVQDPMGCQAEITAIEVTDFVPLEIIGIEIEDTSCNEPNGAVSVFTIPAQGHVYSIDGINFQNDYFFTDLLAGPYTLTIIDQDNCVYTENFNIAPSSSPQIISFDSIADFCNNSLGALELFAFGGGADPYTITLNGVQISPEEATMLDALPAGDYHLVFTDSNGCFDEATTTIEGGPALFINNLQATGPNCDELNGQIIIQAAGGYGDYLYLLNDGSAQTSSIFTQLAPQDYTLTVIDSLGCQLETSINVPTPTCPVFIPNVFSPNFDGINDEFRVYTHTNYDVNILKYEIYDRWGELIWQKGNFTIHTAKEWWDGSFRERPAIQGAYVYVIDALFNNGTLETYKGDVTLIR